MTSQSKVSKDRDSNHLPISFEECLVKHAGLFRIYVGKVARLHAHWLKQNAVSAEDIVLGAFYASWYYYSRHAAKRRAYAFGTYLNYNIGNTMKEFGKGEESIGRYENSLEDTKCRTNSVSQENLEEIDVAVDLVLTTEEKMLFLAWKDAEFNVLKMAREIKMHPGTAWAKIKKIRTKLQKELENRV